MRLLDKYLDNEVALKRFAELYRIFLKFVNNDSDIKLLGSEAYDANKISEIHENTYKENAKLEAFYKSIIDEASEIDKEYFRLLELKDVKEFKGIKERLEKMEEKLDWYDSFLYEKIPFYDYYFSYNGKNYTLEIDPDVYNCEFDNGEDQFVDCELKEYKTDIGTDDEDINRTISFVYDKKDNTIAHIYDINEYVVDSDGDLTISRNNDNLNVQKVMKRL